jgi:hypothetical protein
VPAPFTGQTQRLCLAECLYIPRGHQSFPTLLDANVIPCGSG